MAKLERVAHIFVDRVPSPMDDGVLYISVAFGTAIHKCCCGCGDKVVTPLTPLDWLLIYDGQSVSLYPSIGRRGALCKSHYWIRNNRVVWSYDLSNRKVRTLRPPGAAVYDVFFGLETPDSNLDEQGEHENHQL